MRPAAARKSLNSKKLLNSSEACGIVMDVRQWTAAVPPLQLALGFCRSARDKQRALGRNEPQTQRALLFSRQANAYSIRGSLGTRLGGGRRTGRSTEASQHALTSREGARIPQGEAHTVLHAFADTKILHSSAVGQGGCTPQKTAGSESHACSDREAPSQPPKPASDSATGTLLQLNLEPAEEKGGKNLTHRKQGCTRLHRGHSRRSDPNDATSMRHYTLRLLQLSECHAEEPQQNLAQRQRKGYLTARALDTGLSCRVQDMQFTSETPRNARNRLQSLVQHLDARKIRSKGRSASRPIGQASGLVTHRQRLSRENVEGEMTGTTTSPWALVPVLPASCKSACLSTNLAKDFKEEETVPLSCCPAVGSNTQSSANNASDRFLTLGAPLLNAAVARGAPEKMVGGYMLGRTIGEGTFGKVRVATHALTGECVAIKVLEKEKLRAADDAERVLREIHILRAVRHPHIIHLLEIVETASRLYLVMEYASGGELFDYIVQRQRVDEQTARRFFRQILSGVEALHSMCICHRDLKPENLLLDSQLNIKIVDFGLSNLYRHKHMLKTACGSPSYAAPEIVQGKLYSPLAVDIWSCGVILYALLAGRLPFEENTTEGLYRRIISGTFTCPSHISPEACSLLRGILHTSPLKRLGPLQIKQHPCVLFAVGYVDLLNRLYGRKDGVQIHRELTSARWPFGPPVCCVPECRACWEWLKPSSAQLRRDILEKMPRCHFSLEALECHIRCHPVGPYAATYHLLCMKHQQEQEAAVFHRDQLEGLPKQQRSKPSTVKLPKRASEATSLSHPPLTTTQKILPSCAELVVHGEDKSSLETPQTDGMTGGAASSHKASPYLDVPFLPQLEHQKTGHGIRLQECLLHSIRCPSAVSHASAFVGAPGSKPEGTELSVSSETCMVADLIPHTSNNDHAADAVVAPRSFPPTMPLNEVVATQPSQGLHTDATFSEHAKEFFSILLDGAELVGAAVQGELVAPLLHQPQVQYTQLTSDVLPKRLEEHVLLPVLQHEFQKQHRLDYTPIKSQKTGQTTNSQTQRTECETLQSTQQLPYNSLLRQQHKFCTEEVQELRTLLPRVTTTRSTSTKLSSGSGSGCAVNPSNTKRQSLNAKATARAVPSRTPRTLGFRTAPKEQPTLDQLESLPRLGQHATPGVRTTATGSQQSMRRFSHGPLNQAYQQAPIASTATDYKNQGSLNLLSLPGRAKEQSPGGSGVKTAPNSRQLRRPIGLPIRPTPAEASCGGPRLAGSMTARDSLGSSAGSGTKLFFSTGGFRPTGNAKLSSTVQRKSVGGELFPCKLLGPQNGSLARGAPVALQPSATARRRPSCNGDEVPLPGQGTAAPASRSPVGGGTRTTTAPLARLHPLRICSETAYLKPGLQKPPPKQPTASTPTAAKDKQHQKVPSLGVQTHQKTVVPAKATLRGYGAAKV